MSQLRLLLLTKYGRLGASSRLRSLQYLPWLGEAEISLTHQALFPDETLKRRYARGSYGLGTVLRTYGARFQALLRRRSFDLLWIEKEALPWWPLWLERSLLSGVPYVLDFDDAIFHNYDLHPNPWVRRVYGRRLDGLMRGAALVVAGNQYLAQRARDAGACWVEILPTAIDLERYLLQTDVPAAVPNSPDLPRIVWIGSPSTARYLQLLVAPLQLLALQQPFVLRVIGGGEIDIPGVEVEVLPWAEATEVNDIRACDVGVMPLLDSPWEKGKCGYKLIQYMACGLPVVASRVGVNPEIIDEGVNGFLATTAQEWVLALGKLLSSKQLAREMGQSGRLQVERTYCIQKTGPRLTTLLQQLVHK